jgi:type I restriction enzyme S subunit
VSNFPDSWIYTILSEVAFIQMGQSPNSRSYNETGEGLPFFQGKADFGDLFPTPRKWCTEPQKMAEVGEILLSVRAPVGPTNLANERCCIGRGLASIQAVPPFNQKYLLHFFRHIESWLSQQGTGTTFAGIGSREIQQLEVPVAPLDEQKRISDKLDNLLARVDECRDRLNRIPKILNRFRQSVLNAAGAGVLTETWRKKLQENRSGDLNYLPTDWQICVLTEIAEVIDPNPKHRNPKYFQSGFPFLSTAQFSEIDGWNLTQVKYVNEATVLEQEGRCNFRDGSLAFSRKGTIGKVRKLPTDIRFALLDSVCVINSLQNQNSDYLKIALESKFVQKQISRMARGVALKQVSVGDVRSLEISLPSLDEQHEIVRRVKILLAFADVFNENYYKALARVNQLTSTLLDKAFCGELVPQDPSDEPALALLERIRAEKSMQPSEPRKNIRQRKANMNKMSIESIEEAIHQLPMDKFSFNELYSDLSKKFVGDYDALKDILFALLDEDKPSLSQNFDLDEKQINFTRRHE